MRVRRRGGEHARSTSHNIGDGAYLTTGLLLKFYSYLDVLIESVIYWDKDSANYIQKCGQHPAVTKGIRLGVNTNDLVEVFFSKGPKS